MKIKMKHEYSLETERLILRAPKLEDAPTIQNVINDYLIAKMTLNIPYPYPENGAKEWLERIHNSESENYPFVIILKENDTLIGNISLACHPYFKRAEIGYWLGKTYWNQGYTTEATRCIIQFGFEKLALVRIQAGFFPENIASRRVMEKAGMQYEGTLRSYVQKEDKNRDIGMYAILKEDYVGGNNVQNP